jgi:hypothetical protein
MTVNTTSDANMVVSDTSIRRGLLEKLLPPNTSALKEIADTKKESADA